MKVFLAREAIEDLVAIGEYIAASNPERSLSFVDELREKCFDLADKPLAFQPVPHRSSGDIRKRPFGRYLIFYKVAVHQIEILHIIHGAQDYEKILFPDD